MHQTARPHIHPTPLTSDVQRDTCAPDVDVADPFVVTRYRDEFLSWIPGKVDILFANRTELALLAGCKGDDESVLRCAEHLAPTILMKAGAEGSLFLDRGRLGSSPPVQAKVVDTTGAGDAFAAGYLYGHLAGMGPAEASRLANRVAAGVVSTEGCRYDAVPRGVR